MKAWILHSIGDIKLEDTDIPVPEKGEVLLKVMATGICGSDIPRIYSTGAHNMPLIPGHELSGIVDKVGEGVDTTWAGKRVGVFPLIPCNECEPCKAGHYELCRHYDYLGSRRDGGFAEYVTVPAENLIELPDNVSHEEAAMLEPMSVAVHAIRRVLDIHNPTDTEATIVICGMGTIGILLTLFLKNAGYENIYLIGNKDSQKRRAVEFGISEERFCNSKTENATEWIRTHTNGADIYFECVGSNESLIYGIDSVSPLGHIVTVGNPHGDMSVPRDVYWKILRNEISMTGTWNSDFASDHSDWRYVLERLNEKSIAPNKLITHRYNIEDLKQGFEIMRDKSEDYCKIMMTLN